MLAPLVRLGAAELSPSIADGPGLILLRQLTRDGVKACEQRQPPACFGARSSSAATPLLFAVTNSAAQCGEARVPSTEEHNVLPQLPISSRRRSMDRQMAWTQC